MIGTRRLDGLLQRSMLKRGSGTPMVSTGVTNGASNFKYPGEIAPEV